MLSRPARYRARSETHPSKEPPRDRQHIPMSFSRYVSCEHRCGNVILFAVKVPPFSCLGVRSQKAQHESFFACIAVSTACKKPRTAQLGKRIGLPESDKLKSDDLRFSDARRSRVAGGLPPQHEPTETGNRLSKSRDDFTEPVPSTPECTVCGQSAKVGGIRNTVYQPCPRRNGP